MNPFIYSYRLPVIRVIQSSTIKTVFEEDVTLDYEELRKGYYSDQRLSCKLYYDKTTEDLVFGVLSPSSRDLLLHITYTLKKNQDIVKLRAVDVCKAVRFSRPTFYASIEQLIKNGFLARRCMNEYWINPHYLFNGNRIEYFKKHNPAALQIVAHQKRGATQPPKSPIVEVQPKFSFDSL
ncbi:hypothetical protein [Spirosoma oryzae]|nr:hypothetical protein [Spirosoma oryzae]